MTMGGARVQHPSKNNVLIFGKFMKLVVLVHHVQKGLLNHILILYKMHFKKAACPVPGEFTQNAFQFSTLSGKSPQ